MKISQIITNESVGGTCAGSVATVSKPIGEVQKRTDVPGLQPAEKVMKGKAKKKGPYQNSIIEEGKVKQMLSDISDLTDTEFQKKYKMSKSEAKKNLNLNEEDLKEEDKIIDPTKGKKLKTGLHGKGDKPKFSGFVPPFKSSGVFVSDKRGNKVCECEKQEVAPMVAKALSAYAIANESAGVLAGGLQYEGEGEGATFKNSLHTIIRVATHLDKALSDSADLPEWVSEKMGAAKGMVVSVMDYLISEKERASEVGGEELNELSPQYIKGKMKDAFKREKEKLAQGDVLGAVQTGKRIASVQSRLQKREEQK